MAEKEPLVRWYEWNIPGTKDQLHQLIDVLDSGLPAGWRKVSGNEPILPEPILPSRDQVASYSLDRTQERGGVTLSVDLCYGRELRGGRITGSSPLTMPMGTWKDFASVEADRFLDDGIAPAAAKVGVVIRRATLPDIFLGGLSLDARDSLLAFDKKVGRKLPLEWNESEAWQDFVIAAKRSSKAADFGLLEEWLVTRGWPADSAAELSERFFDQLELLSRYHDTLVIA